MKKITFVQLLLVGGFTFAQTGIKFEESTFSDVLAKAKKENKFVFVDAYTDWCEPCKLVEKKIFPLQSVGDYYNSHFVNVKVNMEKGEGPTLAKKYKIDRYPTFLFINPQGEVVHRQSGYIMYRNKDNETESFLQMAKDVQGSTNKSLE